MSKIDIIWRKWIELFIFGILFINNSTIYVVSAEGNIGCLFAEALCLENLEWCYDDFAFGKCLPQYGLEPEDLFREPLEEHQTRMLAKMLEELQGAGLDWQHIYTQCRMQGALYALKTKSKMPNNLCANLAPDPEVLDAQSPMAFVRFTPPNSEFADEVYYPPLKRAFNDIVDPIKPVPVVPEIYYPKPILGGMSGIPNPLLSRQLEEEIEQRQNQQIEEFKEEQALENRVKDIRNRIELRQMLAEYEAGNLKPPIYRSDQILDGPETDGMNVPYTNEGVFPAQYGVNVGNVDKIFHGNNKNRMNEEEQRDYKRTDSYFKEHQVDLDKDALEEVLEEMIEQNSNPLQQTAFREVSKTEHIPISRIESEAADYEKNEIPDRKVHKKPPNWVYDYDQAIVNNYMPTKAELSNYAEPSTDSGVYTEGGLVYVPGSGASNQLANREEARNLLADMLGFTRHERLDVKKPGPPPVPPPSVQPSTATDVNQGNKEVVPGHMNTEGVAKIKKILPDHNDDGHATHSVDTDYAHVVFKSPIDNWTNGTRIVAALAEMLNMNDYITHPRIDRYEVSFRIQPNPDKKTAADVARQINDPRFQSNLSRRLGVTVKNAGVGDKVKSYDNYSVSTSKMEKADEGPNVTHVMAYMFAGAGAAALIVITITLFLIKKHDKKRDKLGGLQAGLSAAESCTKDYQDLCRARMAGKGNDSPSGRVASLSKDAEVKPPSSRSSTSSWSEEPALTNMDISTGHMVLSYMEDHLRNKGRLQREWEALCRYEAEPGAREAALQPQCVPLNRLTSPLPFDHSRVVLNHLANAEAMDYINASSITDHDPRAPAYVAAQGPLPTTLAHFWQMVWEQGAVVLVSLCRLQENGENSCTRYWPEEGAEVYHIYEVHLVSEHIWCDDYLVRSFYLKNLRTGETRTVTQFHFLSWPQGGVPASAKALLDFRRKVNKSYRGRSCPIIVHSSNGAGRTGAYILLDLVLGRMNKGAREIDIAATLEHLRDQRAGLVATRQQFEFVLMAVAEEVHAILKALPPNEKREPEKREVDKETTKDKDTENEKPIDKPEGK